MGFSLLEKDKLVLPRQPPVAEEAHELKGSLMAFRDLFRINTFNVMIDALVSALQQRLSKYIDTGFLS